MYFLGAKRINFLGDSFVIYCDSIQFKILISTVPCVSRISSKKKTLQVSRKSVEVPKPFCSCSVFYTRDSNVLNPKSASPFIC